MHKKQIQWQHREKGKTREKCELALSVKLMEKRIHQAEENNMYDPTPTAATPKKDAAPTAKKKGQEPPV